MEIWKLISIFNDKNRFLTLNEIYAEYAARYDTWNYTDYKAAIRTAIYRNCVDRDLNVLNKNIFISFDAKGVKGQKYGLYEWVFDNKEELNKTTLQEINKLPRYYIKKDFGMNILRDEKIKKEALKRANYKCECNQNHLSFIRKSDGTNYMEIHHLIPLELQFLDKYKNINLDCLANVISLCSNCHNNLHYGINPEKILEKLYNERKDELIKAGIDVSLEELISYYK